ncbi:class I SAM-dependent methyltransferase [Paenibacillus montanisoli]|uniref:Small RNA 2'-O-methyltransferase n=1 Tax=Paenibacillus montanisoli TaxID=2081970 RepID=A0A328U0F5_9BACL|nr:class I SAM-dependent methyltransferase [Paenibacillus montanisoli]RAP74931.1 SAM-dependent methyltransferase [Paenibacillus montanisoli]
MAIVQLTSTNPRFSFLIKKNPETGMLLRAIRKGMAYGWYGDEQTFNVYFKDADNEISFKQHESESFEYLNVSRYNTPILPLNVINEFFSAPLKAQNELDTEGCRHTFYINMIHIEMMRYIEFFQKHLKDYSFQTEHLAYKSYSLSITTSRSIYELLHVVCVLCLFLSMFGEEYIDISDSILDKYMKSLNVIDAPFYIRSLFVRNFLSSRERFNKYKVEAESTSRYDIRFDFGGTAFQRRSYIGNALRFNKAIVDIGCGEGYYALPFAGKLEHSYYAIDLNEESLEVVKRKAETKQVENIALFGSVDHFLDAYNGEAVDVILTEVIEHMPEEEAARLIRQICRNIAFDRLIITTPNADFNVYYELSGFRHDDHKWEMGSNAFQRWFRAVIEEEPLDVQYIAVGDGVDGVQTTQGAIVQRRGA